jgi:uncharacterized protein (TIGR02231 family)
MRRIGLLTLFAISGSAQPFAAEIPVTSKIDAVTAFPTGAEVTRVIKVKLDAGEHTLVVGHITGEAVSKSIRIEASTTDKLEIGSVDARKITLSSTDPAVAQSARKKIEDQIQALRDQNSAQDDVVKVAGLQLDYLNNLAKLPQSSGGGSSGGGSQAQTDWRMVFGVIGESGVQVTGAIAAAKLKQREIRQSIDDLQKELQAIAVKDEERTQLRIHVSAAAPLETTLSLRYQVRTASWTAFYDARLTGVADDKAAAPSAGPSLAITRRASIQQKTGEEWDDVALALSTTRPGAATAAPKLATLVAEFDPEAEAADKKPGVALGGEADASSGVAKPQASVTAFQTIHHIPGRVTIKHSDEAKRLQIGGETLQPTLVVRTTPRLDDTAYLYTRFALPKASPALQPGQVSLFRDGVFVGAGKFPLVAPGEDYDLGFGADERVKVRRAVLDNRKGETGTFTTSYFDLRRYSISFKNLHPHPVEVQVIDRTPIAMRQDIKVDFSMETGPQPTTKNIDDRRGVYLWQIKAQPDEEKQLVFSYKVSAPSGKHVLYRDLTLEEMQGAAGK